MFLIASQPLRERPRAGPATLSSGSSCSIPSLSRSRLRDRGLRRGGRLSRLRSVALSGARRCSSALHEATLL